MTDTPDTIASKRRKGNDQSLVVPLSSLYYTYQFSKKVILLSFCIRYAALGNLKASFHCTHWHRFFPLKKVFFYLSVSPARKDFFRKPTRPSLPLRKAPPLISVFSPQGRRGKPPSGARNRYALRLADHQRSSPYCAGWDRLGITILCA